VNIQQTSKAENQLLFRIIMPSSLKSKPYSGFVYQTDTNNEAITNALTYFW